VATHKTKSAKRAKAPACVGGPALAARPLVHAPMGLKVVSGLCLLGLAVILAASFIYRLERPTLTVKTVREAPHGAPGAAGGPAGAMGGGMGMEQTPPAMAEMMDMMTQLKDKPDDFDLLMRLGERFLTMEFPERAVIFFERAEKVKPDDPDLLNALGVAYFQSSAADKAKEKFERLLARDKGDFRAHYNLGILYKHALKDEALAKKHFAAVLASPAASDQAKEQARKEMAE
jgi:tetratricopeptide (TPR) repeat protein